MSYAFIIYGLPVNLNFVEKDDYDYTDYLAERYRINKPKGLYSDNVAAFKAYYKNKENLVRRLGIKIETHGNNKEYGYILGIHDSSFAISGLEILEDKYFKIDKTWNGILEKFCKELGLSFISPKWYIGTYEN